jgi:hypothetical protein
VADIVALEKGCEAHELLVVPVQTGRADGEGIYFCLHLHKL